MKIRGTHGGFYQLFNVKQDEKLFDIEILIDWQWISSQQGFKKLEEWSEKFKKVTDLKNQQIEGSCIEFSELKNYLTGYARVIEISNETDYEIQSIQEGKMSRGQFDGYSRKFEVKKEKNGYVPICTVGFWRENKPFGTSIQYENDVRGSCSTNEQGCYDGVKESELNVSDFKINNFPKRGVLEETARKEAATLRAEALLVWTQEYAARA